MKKGHFVLGFIKLIMFQPTKRFYVHAMAFTLDMIDLVI